MRQFYLITTAHLEDKLWFMEEEDFVVGMNHVALQAASQPEVRIMAFILMSNHVHFVVLADAEGAKKFINSFMINCTSKSNRRIIL